MCPFLFIVYPSRSYVLETSLKIYSPCDMSTYLYLGPHNGRMRANNVSSHNLCAGSVTILGATP